MRGNSKEREGGQEKWFCVTAGYRGVGHGRGSDMQ
jgi:hypothetical protein